MLPIHSRCRRRAGARCGDRGQDRDRRCSLRSSGGDGVARSPPAHADATGLCAQRHELLQATSCPRRRSQAAKRNLGANTHCPSHRFELQRWGLRRRGDVVVFRRRGNLLDTTAVGEEQRGAASFARHRRSQLRPLPACRAADLDRHRLFSGGHTRPSALRPCTVPRPLQVQRSLRCPRQARVLRTTCFQSGLDICALLAVRHSLPNR